MGVRRSLKLKRLCARLAAGAAATLLAAALVFAVSSAGLAQARPARKPGENRASRQASPTSHQTDPTSHQPSLASRQPGITPHRPQSLTPRSALDRPGVPTAAPTDRALAQTLRQTTGLSASVVTTRDVCPPVSVGRARCAARALVLRSDGALVRPHVRDQAPLGQVDPASRPGFAVPASGASSTPPQAGTPAYLEQAYDLSYLSQTGGEGDTVAIIDAYDDPGAQADLNIYRSTYGLPACSSSNGCFEKVNENGASSPLPAANTGWEEEESLDLDAVSALCPNCHILLVEANSSRSSDLKTAMATAASAGANQISDSWTATSSGVLSGTYTFPQIATVAATGDTGYAGPGENNYPAAFPGVTAAGGTSLAQASGGANARGFSEGAWSLNDGSGGGSGCDLQVAKPAYQADTGCTGRSYADLSADADPSTGRSCTTRTTVAGCWSAAPASRPR